MKLQTLTLSLMATLTAVSTQAVAAPNTATIVIRENNQVVTSEEFMKGRPELSNGELNPLFWAFHYKFKYASDKLNDTACFAGSAEAAAEILKKVNEGKVGDDEIEVMRNLEVAENEIRFQLMNLRPEVERDHGTFDSIRIVRCGVASKKMVKASELVTSYEAFKANGFLGYITGDIFGDGLSTFEVLRKPEVLREDFLGYPVYLENGTCKMTNVRSRGLEISFKAGDRLKLISMTTLDNGKRVFYLHPENNLVRAILSRITLICDLPTRATVQDLEKALDGIFKIRK